MYHIGELRYINLLVHELTNRKSERKETHEILNLNPRKYSIILKEMSGVMLCTELNNCDYLPVRFLILAEF